MDKHPIPVAALDADIAILGKKGGGKTYTAKGIVERLLDMGRRVLVLDPLGVWAGLRTGADVTSPGYPVAIFGGAHGDMPLDPAAAVPMADILARENVPAVLDVADLSKASQQAFLLAFLRELRRVNTEALTIVLEEADVFAPQNPMGDDSKALHVEIDWIARRGRFRGFRLITITQRPARLSKDVLTQCATLVAHRLPAPQDRDAVKAWVDGNGDKDQAREVFDTLAQLAVGEAWVWASEEGSLKRERFPTIKTLDTSATPKAGERRIEPKTLAQVDVSGIRAAMEAAKAAEPTGSPKRAQNMREIIPTAPDPAAIEAAEQRGYEQGKKDGIAIGWADAANHWHARLASVLDAINEERIAAGDDVADKVAVDERLQAIAANAGKQARASVPRTEPASHVTPAGLKPAKQKILDAIAWLNSIGHATPDKMQVAMLAGYSHSSGGYNNSLGALRSAGLIEYPEPGRTALTPEGKRVARKPAGAPTHEAVFQKVAAMISPAQVRMLAALCRAHPKALAKVAVAQAVDASPTSGGFNNNLGRLRSLGLINYPTPGNACADDRLFPEKRP